MNAIVYTNILLTVIISACAAAGLTDEQLAQIFSEKSDRNELLPDSQDDFVSIRDEVNNLDQTLSLLGDTDDAVDLQNVYKDMTDSFNEYKRSSENFELDGSDEDSTFGDSLDLAYLHQQMADMNTESKREDMNRCLQAYGHNSLLCFEILKRGNIQDTEPCSTQTCNNRLTSLLKPGIKRTRLSTCKTVGCRISQYVKKSFCNRYGCGRRRKKNTNDALELHGHGSFLAPRSNDIRESRPRDDFRRAPLVCGTSAQGCQRRRVKKIRKFRL